MKHVLFWSSISGGIIVCALLRQASGKEASPIVVTGLLLTVALGLIVMVCRRHS